MNMCQVQREEGFDSGSFALFFTLFLRSLKWEWNLPSRWFNGNIYFFFRSQVKIFDCIDFCSARD